MPASSDELSTSVIRMLRMLHATRARAPRVHPSVEPSHHSVLVAVREHPSRVGDIAERNLGDGRAYTQIYDLNAGRVQPDGGSLELARLLGEHLPAPGEPAADFRIDGPAAHGIAGLVNLYGIESPGLTASLAIGDHVAGLLD